MDVLTSDLAVLHTIKDTRYLNPHTHVPKEGQLYKLAFEYSQDPLLHHQFEDLFQVSVHVFDVLLVLIEDHPIFHNNSNNPQAPVREQLQVLLYWMGRYGNGASITDVARISGILEGSVENFTDRCLTAIEALHDDFIHPLTDEKEVEKQWIETHLDFGGLWCEGYMVYDGTIVVLHRKPALDGEGYYTRKANYGLNVQVCISDSLLLCQFTASQHHVNPVMPTLTNMSLESGFVLNIAWEH
ncbi:hypothetical protein E1B28_008447 [Marasmius oreades]|uniref:DDE Tnp4 domain-containing protein n=1 Tax=Marasmius oreades TaxID=181124 RepID=A0A9P7RYF1_9AGAR|nr:uncharacterized protein E1B28_008447 [Marasmius oreades]KAG7092066.1 hypothetical protein E1B28_008447 [Marasmius oreades]